MHQNPVQRTVRFIILSVGFVLFVLLAVRSAAQVSDPRFLRGNPFLFARTHSPQLVGDVVASLGTPQEEAAQLVADQTQPNSASSSPSGQTKGKASEHSATVTAVANSQINPGQIKKDFNQTPSQDKD